MECHGDSFHTREDRDHEEDTSWTNRELYASDVVGKDGKYYLYAYILGSKSCVAVSDTPEGTEPDDFFEASSPRRIGNLYYLIYSLRRECKLA